MSSEQALPWNCEARFKKYQNSDDKREIPCMLLQWVMTWELNTRRSQRKTAHFSPHFQTAPFLFPLFLVFIPTCVASAATKLCLESNSRFKALS